MEVVKEPDVAMVLQVETFSHDEENIFRQQTKLK
jgi:hypothetical protein